MKQKRIVFTMTVIILLISSCMPQVQPTPTVTSNRIETPTVTVPTSTATATSTPRPTRTATPIPDWVTNFTEPILKAIANRLPTYQDDFSNPQSGWYVGRKENNLDPQSQATPPMPGYHIFGERGYIDGSYFTIADPFSCVGGQNPEMGAFTDFVAEFDVRFVSGKDGDWQIRFHRNDIGQYSLTMNISWNNIGFVKCSPQTGPACEGIATYSGGQIHGGTEWNHMLLIERGAKLAAYANGAPILYTEDKTYTDEFGRGDSNLGSCNAGDMPMEIRWDNFKVWDISNLP